ncbi:MAG: hypothetical protein C4523_00690 [Myxococcales bacterium]|nr:MAG: hypothetical protein C4523_00690 [Myxococcales bacterium]
MKRLKITRREGGGNLTEATVNNFLEHVIAHYEFNFLVQFLDGHVGEIVWYEDYLSRLKDSYPDLYNKIVKSGRVKKCPNQILAQE